MYTELILNLTLLVALSVVSGFLIKRWPGESLTGALGQGCLFGGAAVVGMFYPAVFGPGLIFDGRSIMLSLAAYFFGPWAALPAVLATGGFRLAIGGEGTLMGVLVIYASALIGLGFRRWHPPQAGPVPVTRLLALGLAVHAAMLLLFLTLPGDLPWAMLRRVGLPVILLYPLITILAGKILADQQVLLRMVDELQRAHRDLDVTLQSIGDAVITTDLQGHVVRMNPAAEPLTGWTQAEARGRPLGEVCRLLHEQTRQPVPSPVEAALRTGQVVSLSNHTLLVSRDGKERVIADSAAPIRDGAGVVTGVVFVFSDKTAEHATQEALRLVDAALEAAANAIIITDRTGLIVWVNPAFTTLSGYTAGEAIGRNPWDGQHAPEFYGQLWATILAGKVWQGIVVNHRKDGSPYTEEMMITPVRNAQGDLTHFIAIKQDITARKRAEDELRTSEKELRASQRFAHVGSWHLKLATNQVVWSEELYHMYGFDPALPPPPYTEHMKLFTHESWERLSTALANTRETGVPYELELETVMKDGRNGWMWVRGETEVDAEGRTIGLWGAAQDITARKQAENKARQSYDLLANLARLVPGVVYQYRLFPDGRSAFPYASPGMNDIYEVTPAEVREDATPVFGRIHPDDYGRVGDLIQESARTLQTFYCEFRVILPRQGLRWRWSQAQPERMEDGGTLWHGIISDVTERKEAEAALRETNQFLDNLIDCASAPIIVWDPLFRITRFNRAFQALTGRRADEVLGRELPVLFPPDQVPILMEQIRHTLRGERWESVELPIAHVDGSIHTVLWNSATILAADGTTPVATIAQGQDITRRKQAEERLRESELRWRQAVQGSAAGIWEYNFITGEAFYSDRSKEILGYEPADISQDRERWTALIHPDDAPIGRQAMAEHLSGLRPYYQAEHRFLCKDGTYRWISSRARAVFDDTGRLIRIVGTHVDVHERRLAEERLRESEAYIKMIMDHLPLGVAVNSVAPAVDFQYMNDNFPAFYQTTREALLQPDAFWTSVIEDPVIREELRQRVLADCASGDPARMLWEDVPITRQGRETTYISAQNIPIPGRGLMISTVWDVTSRVSAQTALQASLREKEALLKEVHHRVKNNLQVITSLLRLEAGRSPDPGTVSVLDEMKDRIRSMALLHETLYRSGNLAEVDMAAYLRQLTAQLFRSQVKHPGAVHLDLELAPVRLEIDRAIPCGLIVNELVTNSLKHAFAAGRTGRVHIGLQPVAGGELLQLRVSDNGVGLPAGFELKRTRSLGLHLVGDLSRQLQGVLEIGSAGPGAAFTVTFSPRPGADPEAQFPPTAGQK